MQDEQPNTQDEQLSGAGRRKSSASGTRPSGARWPTGSFTSAPIVDVNNGTLTRRSGERFPKKR